MIKFDCAPLTLALSPGGERGFPNLCVSHPIPLPGRGEGIPKPESKLQHMALSDKRF